MSESNTTSTAQEQLELDARKEEMDKREAELKKRESDLAKKRKRTGGKTNPSSDGKSPPRKKRKANNNEDDEIPVVDVTSDSEEDKDDGSPSPDLTDVGLEKLNKDGVVAMLKKEMRDKKAAKAEFKRRKKALEERELMMLSILKDVKSKSSNKEELSDSDEDEDFNPEVKGWRAKYGGKKGSWHEIVKELLEKRLKGIATLKAIMQRKNFDFNKKTILKEGYVDWKVPGLIGAFAALWLKDLKSRITSKSELDLVDKAGDKFLLDLLMDAAIWIEEEIVGILEMMFNNIRTYMDQKYLVLDVIYVELRTEFLRNDKMAKWNQMWGHGAKQNNGSGRGRGRRGRGRGRGGGRFGHRNHNGNGRNMGGKCKDWNNKGRCAYQENCKWIHACSTCGSMDHGTITCPSA
eukprot:65862_1